MSSKEKTSFEQTTIKKARSETTNEESEYQKILQAKWLQDYGELDTDSNNNLETDTGAKENWLAPIDPYINTAYK